MRPNRWELPIDKQSGSVQAMQLLSSWLLASPLFARGLRIPLASPVGRRRWIRRVEVNKATLAVRV
ncbi:hypothetical protein BJX68DRAFT_225456 [Aspergillus pseudodeflectus]|uniref:Uncharacterized protein n=1 Tax=Aspergillus pseudodeflectus TaxID=176178 RepID=A0ABR4L7I0_9EURO